MTKQNISSGSQRIVHFTWRALGILVLLLAGIRGVSAQLLESPERKILYYSQISYAGAVGEFEENAEHVTLSTYTAGFLPWDNVVSDPGGILYYNKQTGMAMIGKVDAMGNHTITRVFPRGYFAPGWTHIVSHRGFLFFYNSGNGTAAIGILTAAGFYQYTSYPAYSFLRGWTHIVSTQNGLLFYSKDTGAGAVGDWDYLFGDEAGGYQLLRGISFKTWSSFQPGSFNRGWTSIVETNTGVLFYRQSDGLQVMVDIYTGGAVTTRMWTQQYLKPGYTTVVAAGDNIELYDAAAGDAALASASSGSLAILWERPAYFSTGWTHIISLPL